MKSLSSSTRYSNLYFSTSFGLSVSPNPLISRTTTLQNKYFTCGKTNRYFNMNFTTKLDDYSDDHKLMEADISQIIILVLQIYFYVNLFVIEIRKLMFRLSLCRSWWTGFLNKKAYMTHCIFLSFYIVKNQLYSNRLLESLPVLCKSYLEIRKKL